MVGRREQAARDAVLTVRTEYAATPPRPAGHTRWDRPFAELVVELDRGLAFAARRARASSGSDPALGQEDALERAVVETLPQTGDALTGGRGRTWPLSNG